MGDIIFVLFLIMTVVSAAITALSKNLIHSVFSLMATFFGVAGLYVFLLWYRGVRTTGKYDRDAHY